MFRSKLDVVYRTMTKLESDMMYVVMFN